MRQQRLATYATRRELERDYRASDNSAGPFGCARLVLGSDRDDDDMPY